MMHLGNNIKKIRKLKNETQEIFAERMGVTLPMQKSYERNKSQPDIIYMEKLEQMTGLSSRQLRTDAINTEILSKKVAKVTEEHFSELKSINDVLPLGDLKVTLKDYVDLLNEYKNKAEDAAKKAEERERELLSILKENIITIKANSEKTLNDLQGIKNMTRADDLSMMEGTDKILGREPGVTALEAGIVELSLKNPDQDIHKNDANDTKGKPGKAKQK